MKITIVDYGAGNVPSVERALLRLGAESERTNSLERISKAKALLLPGVGHYAALVRALDEQNMRAPLIGAIQRGVPFLGICLGLQVLFESSEEAPQLRGLQLLPGTVCALPSNVKLPHMGWNQLNAKRESRLLAGIDTGAYFYFAHSYAVRAIQMARQPPPAPTARNSPPSWKSKIFSPCNFIRKKAATRARASCGIF